MAKKLNIKIRQLPNARRPGKVHIEDDRTVKPHELEIVKALSRFGFDIVCKKNLIYHINTLLILFGKMRFGKLKG
ncbi:MAG: hypothetical protein LBL08_01505 [Candidatus Nomurabacteria bacterium]|jgi:hypothetical protein|nr:hypothetical protein [Candidatus Nomurabacteria bacterium]